MSEVIAALEAFLGKQQAKQPLLTDPKLAAELETACTAFNRDGLAKAKQWIPIGFVLTCLVLCVVMSIVHWRTGIASACSVWRPWSAIRVCDVLTSPRTRCQETAFAHLAQPLERLVDLDRRHLGDVAGGLGFWPMDICHWGNRFGDRGSRLLTRH